MSSARRFRLRKKKRVRKKRSIDRLPSRPRGAYLGLGSNVGNRRAHLTAALADIESFAPIDCVSSFYSSDPVGYAGQRRFWNAVAEVRWAGAPEALLRAVKEGERRGGRRRTFAGGPREMEVDILDLGGVVRIRRDPILPHPSLAGRRFALAPLAEIAPEWRHPVNGLTAKQMLRTLPQRPGVSKIRS